MPITRSKSQKDITLHEFYENAKAENKLHKLIAPMMIRFVDMVNEIFPNTPLIGQTSHLRLGIVPFENRETDEWKVIVSNNGHEDFYFIQYKLPESKQPWENAWVTANFVKSKDLKKYFLIAMRESEGWKDNEELKGLLAKYQLN